MAPGEAFEASGELYAGCEVEVECNCSVLWGVTAGVVGKDEDGNAPLPRAFEGGDPLPTTVIPAEVY